MAREFVSRYANPQEGDIYLYFNDLEKRVREFNNYARSKGSDFRVRLTGESEPYAYYAQLVLPSRETAFFTILPHLVWSTNKNNDLPQSDVEEFNKAALLWNECFAESRWLDDKRK